MPELTAAPAPPRRQRNVPGMGDFRQGPVDIILPVPEGTVEVDVGRALADLTGAGARFVVAECGLGTRR